MYSQDDRQRARRNMKKTRELVLRLEGIASGRVQQTPDFAAGIAALTGTPDLEGQHRALSEMTERLEETHRERLIEAARDDLSAFAEVMAPHEIPAPHHLFLAEKLMTVESEPRKRLLISMPPGHAKDLCVETPVMMGDGTWRRLGDVRIGEMVMTHRGRAREVLAVHDQGVREVLKIVTASGRTVFAHPEHPFLTPVDWRQAKDLRVGVALALPKLLEIDTTRQDSLESEFIYLGYMMARAIVTGRVYNRMLRVSTKFRCDDPVVLADIKAQAKTLGITFKQAHSESYGMRAIMLQFDAEARGFLEEHGVYNCEKSKLRVPPLIFSGSESEIAAFLGAIASCDAQFVPARNQHTGGQRKMILWIRDNLGLAQDIQRLFLRIGVKADLSISRSSNYNYDSTTFFKVVITDAASMDIMRNTLRMIGRNAQRWSDETIAAHSFGSSDYHTDRILSITTATPRPTRCLTVEEDSSFLAEGLAVHNSTYSSRYYPAWYLGREENRKYIQAGHTQKFAEEEFGKKTRDIINSVEYGLMFPGVALRHDSKAAGAWRLTNNNSYVTKGIGQGISGFRSTCNSVDDPYKDYASAQSPTTRRVTWDWFANDFMTRLLPHGSAMIVATRWHLDDLCGRIEDMMRAGELEDDWEIINLPALCMDPTSDPLNRLFGAPLWPDFYTLELLQRQRALMSNTQWSCLYEGRPQPAEGNVIKREWLVHSSLYPTIHMAKKIVVDPLETMAGKKVPQEEPGTLPNQRMAQIPYRRTVVSVDSAESESARANFSAITVWRETPNRYHYLVDAVRGRWDFTALIEQVESMAIRWDADFILMEKKGAGMQYIQSRGNTNLAPCPVFPTDPTGKGDKTFRMDGISPIFQQKRVIFPEHAPWLNDYERELLEFPGSKNDDYADATSQYLAFVRETSGSRRGVKKMSL